ncbi:glycosyltransferase family 2 protein [Solimonas sp. K1W22B-7]|uniref:glycosyltransferase family 2 protein n=1 Tax=Solimonas sp. K1W22B-7 TaxID=2303331 RepID=UPI000E331A6E|nr:glycosyltransferase [Solimonas sp. K1W22B-7]AXQ27358.1 glycosyltransferase family 2 protein [Solimonas sp. K1W22B-7]
MDSIFVNLVSGFAVFLAMVSGSAEALVLKFAPFALLLEMPLYLLTWLGVMHYLWRRHTHPPAEIPYYPRVTCICNAYAEGRDVQYSIRSLLEQIYPGHIELLLVLDGAVANRATYDAIKELMPQFGGGANRSVRFIPKPQRGGRVSATNTGLLYATGEIVMALDADTSFDNEMVAQAIKPFADPHVVAATGPLRARNGQKSMITRFQAVEYMLAIYLGKVGLAEWNLINNLPGAFMIYRKSILDHVGGWNTGTGEDLDLTLRVKQYLKRHPELKLVFAPGAVAHTEVPDTFAAFYKQRLRWDGDLSYIYFRKHWQAFSPMIGWRNFIGSTWYGLLFQIFLPILQVGFLAWMLLFQPAPFFIGTMLLIYVFYLTITVLQFLLFLALLSERPAQDARYFWVLPLMPLFMVSARVWSVIATFHEWFNRAHQDSPMGPWWVIRQGGPR